MKGNITRREVIKGGLIAGSLMPMLALPSLSAIAAGLPLLDENNPTAKALGFVSDASNVDAGANPTYKPGQKCGGCAQFHGKTGETAGSCNIFPGHSVPQGGWCKVWAQKAAG